MPDHVRTSIRTAVLAAITAANTAAGARVYSERVDAIAQGEYPCVIAKVVNESQERISFGGGGPGPCLLRRSMQLNVYYTLKQESGYTNAADEAMRLIESSLSSTAIAGLQDITPTGTLFDEESDGEHQLYTLTQEFRLTYHTSQADPATAR